MPSVDCGTCGVRSYCDGPQTTCEACADRLRKRVAELETELAAERAWRKRVTIAGTAILDALHLSFGTHDAEQELRNALGSPVTPAKER